MRRRLTLITEIISPYRVPVFNELAARDDIDLHVIFLSQSDPTLRSWRVPLNEIQFRYEVLPAFRKRVGGYHLLLNRGLKRALETSRPDVILCGGYNYLASWQAAYWARRNGIPFLLWFESTKADYRNKYGTIEILKRRFLNLCCGFVVPGKSSEAYLQSLGVNSKTIFIAPNAVDNELFSKEANASRQDEANCRRSLALPERYMVCVARLTPSKGIFDLLEAYATLEESVRSSFALVYVGDGAAKLELERRAALIKPGDVRFAGFVQIDQLPTYYALALASVLPTHSDPWGLVVNEAMACATPVIATEVAGCVQDLIQDGINGRVVPLKDITKLAAAVRLLATESDLRATMGHRCSEIIKKFSPVSCAAGIAQAALTVRPN
jgi:glycosyltransferase involved in cell wall biosynthesis